MWHFHFHLHLLFRGVLPCIHCAYCTRNCPYVRVLGVSRYCISGGLWKNISMPCTNPWRGSFFLYMNDQFGEKLKSIFFYFLTLVIVIFFIQKKRCNFFFFRRLIAIQARTKKKRITTSAQALNPH